MKIIKYGSKKLEKIYNRGTARNRRIEDKVRHILEDVRLFGDDALIEYTKKFDKVKLSPRQIKVAAIEISAAYQNIDPRFVSTLKVIMENVTRFYSKVKTKSWRIKDGESVLGENITALDKVGIYIPAGTAPLVSSVYMTVLPAKLAGVKKIILMSPPDRQGNINPHILAIANLLKVDEIFRIGGAQAIGAMAYGTKTVPKVDKIVGPGNPYVSEAKRQVFGTVDIDMIAGPTELVIIANQHSDPRFVIADLKAQSEHAGGLSILITNSKAFANEIKSKVPDTNNMIVLTKNLNQAIDVANRIAPEHLEVLVTNPNRIAKQIRHAGAIFLGPYSPTALGDYIAGPSHVLPTNGTARFFSGLSVRDFMKTSHIINYSKKALEKAREPLEKIASIEGLVKHLDSVKIRFE
ncbi:MAG: histidinol dehydrogenase [Candidatus Omnitrophota bacterium]